MTMPLKRSRRQFLSRLSTGVAAGFFINPTRAAFSDSPNERLNIAAVGCTNRAGANIRGVESQNIFKRHFKSLSASLSQDRTFGGLLPYPSKFIIINFCIN